MGISLGGIIAGGMGGAAAAVGDLTKGYIDDQRRNELMQQTQAAELAKSNAIDASRQRSGDDHRKKLAGELNSTVDRLTREEQVRRLQGFDAEHGDGSVTRTPEGLTDWVRADVPLDDADQARILQRAGLETGQMDVKDASANSLRTAGLEAQNLRLQDRMAAMERMSTATNASREAVGANQNASREAVGADRNASREEIGANQNASREEVASIRAAAAEGKILATAKPETTLDVVRRQLADLDKQSHGRTLEEKAKFQATVAAFERARDQALEKINSRDAAPPRYAGSPPSPGAPSGSPRRDVSSARDAWNKVQ